MKEEKAILKNKVVSALEELTKDYSGKSIKKVVKKATKELLKAIEEAQKKEKKKKKKKQRN
ncbi:MAG: hypothetical protein IPH28_17100 [Cytophagaceae bacterium]|nr:hypothetical protein [Cytophagaceae bacterium]